MTDASGVAGNERAGAGRRARCRPRQIEEATPLGGGAPLKRLLAQYSSSSSPLSDFITGHALCVDGGLTMRKDPVLTGLTG